MPVSDAGLGAAKTASVQGWRRAQAKSGGGWRDALAVALLVALSVFLFRNHVFGDGLYIGNPDRLNSNLKILKFHIDGLSQGHLNAWSSFEMLGYDTFALPYTFPSAFTYLAFLLGPGNLYVSAGYECVVLLAAAGIAAYGFLRIEIARTFPCIVGALLYQFSAQSVLAVSQNDLSFAVFVLTPILLILVRRIQFDEPRPTLIMLSVVFLLLLYFTFLQKASYALILVGSYTIYRSITQRDWRILAVVVAAGLVGLIGAFPRLLGIGIAIKEYSRVVKGLHFENFDDVYRFQTNFPGQILRWFDGGLFGRFPSDGTLVLKNNINLTEGFLLYTSSLVPFLIIFGMVRYGGRSLGLVRSLKNDGAFFFWFLIFTFSVIVIPAITEIIWLLYFKIDFTHARILITGLMPLSMTVALLLVDREPPRPDGLGNMAGIWLAAILLAVVAVFGIDNVAERYLGSMLVHFGDQGMQLRHSAIARIGLSAVTVAILMFVPWVMQSQARRSARYLTPSVRLVVVNAAFRALGVAIGLHTFLNADFQVNGPQTRAEPAFLAGNNYYSNKENFHPPEPDAIAAVKQRLDNDNYRAVLICDPNVAGGFCAGHIPEFWRLRVVDGYYGLGVPTRIGSLPWRAAIGLRTISFTDAHEIEWPILSLLNVKYAVKVTEAFFRNNQSGPGEPSRAASIDDLDVISNPLPVVPRFFFARKIVPVSSASEAAGEIFKGQVSGDVAAVSFVENIARGGSFDGGTAIVLAGEGDHVHITVDPASSDRFFVANELYFPGWSAIVDGKLATIYPTNAVMRGIIVPAGATTIEFAYTPVVFQRRSIAMYLIALFAFGVFIVVFGRKPFAERG